MARRGRRAAALVQSTATGKTISAAGNVSAQKKVAPTTRKVSIKIEFSFFMKFNLYLIGMD